MNNVWTAIAFRAPCAISRTLRRPLLELFNGHAKYRSSRCMQLGRESSRSYLVSFQTSDRPLSSRRSKDRDPISRQTFSTTALLLKRPSKGPKTQISPDPKLDAAPTIASHTEGLPEESGELTWRDYDPTGGMPLPGGERTRAQINKTFGREGIDADTGNYILSVVYWRRMSGALIDVGLRFPKDSGVTDEQAARALAYIRSVDPNFDEQAAAQVWIEEESHRLQEELEERAVKLRLYKRDEPQEELPVEEEPEGDQGTAEGRSRNRESQLQRIRAENEARYESEQVQKAQAEAKAELSAMHTHRGPLELGGGVQPSVELVTYTGPDGIAISRPQTKAWLQPVERKPWVKYYEEQAEIVGDKVPQLSLLQRLGPSLLMLLLIFSVAAYVSDTYTPPPKSARLWPDTPPAVATLTALTGTMAAFFILSRFPPFWRTLNKYFTLVPVYPHALSLIGGAFRHQPLSHLLINTLSLWLFGLILHEDVGRGAFLSIFVLSGALGGYTSLTYHVLKQNWGTYMFGSSGCVLGVVAAACTLRPNSTIKVFGQDVPIAVWLWLAFWGVAEAIAMVRFKGLNIDHAGHLGGLIGGFGSALWLRQRANERRRMTPITEDAPAKRQDLKSALD